MCKAESRETNGSICEKICSPWVLGKPFWLVSTTPLYSVMQNLDKIFFFFNNIIIIHSRSYKVHFIDHLVPEVHRGPEWISQDMMKT